MHCHLVPIEVCIECGADQRVYPDGLALHQDGLESLNAEPVQRRCAVQQHGMISDDLLENLIHLRTLTLHDLLGALDRLGDSLFHELVDDERLEQLDPHGLGKATLVQLQLRSHDDDRTAGIIDTFA